MGCYYPIDAWKSKVLNESGKRSVVFNRRDGDADTHLQVPCGRCTGCNADRALMWSVRLFHEASCHDQNSFVTFTYADPCPDKLCKEHLQNFFKRLRHKFDFRYFAVGEYGEQTRRPHYHALIFGQDFLDDSFEVTDTLYSNPVVAQTWGYGMVSIGRVEMSSCCYVAGYCNKKIGDPDTFSLMSRRPGIGHDWFDKYKDDLRRIGSVVIDGREFPIPKRYLDWDNDDTLQNVRDERKLMFTQMSMEEQSSRRAALPNRELNRKAALSLRSGKL